MMVVVRGVMEGCDGVQGIYSELYKYYSYTTLIGGGIIFISHMRKVSLREPRTYLNLGWSIQSFFYFSLTKLSCFLICMLLIN